MEPSPAAIAAIRARVADWSQSDATVAAGLNAPAAPNPAARVQTPRPFSASDVLGSLAPASLAKLVTVAFIARIRDDINAQDRAACGLWAQVLAAGGVVTPQEAGTIMGLLAATEPDPDYQSQISWAQANLGRPVDPSDVASSRPES